MTKRQAIERYVKYLSEQTGLNLGIESYAPGDRYGKRIRLVEVDQKTGGMRDFGQFTLGEQNFLDQLATFSRVLEVAARKKNEEVSQ